MRKSATARSRPTLAQQNDVAWVQKKLAFRLLLVFSIPLVIILVLGLYAYRISARLKEVEALERLNLVERVYKETSNLPWAISEYSELADRYHHPQVFVRLGALYFERGEPGDADRAITMLKDAIALRRDYWEAYSTLSYIYLKQNKQAEAVQAGEVALRSNTFDAQTYNNLAWIYATARDASLSDPQRAEGMARKAVAYTRCRNIDYLDTLAVIYTKMDRFDEANQIRRAVGQMDNPSTALQPKPSALSDLCHQPRQASASATAVAPR
jgi:tetratricopeptide (TPR) repeat protein